MLAVQKDVGGSEFFQLYTLADGRLTLLTDGRSRNAVQRAGAMTGAGSATARPGATAPTPTSMSSIRAIPSTNRMVAQVQGGGWAIADFSPDGRRAVVDRITSRSPRVNLYLLDLATGRMTPIGDPNRDIAYGGAAVRAATARSG